MKKNRFLPIILIGMFLSVSSCDNFLDIAPKGYAIPTTVEDYRRILNDEILIRFLANDLDKLADSYYIANVSQETDLNSLDLRIYGWIAGMYTPADFQYNSPWQQCYSVIYQYNAVIENIDAATGGTAAEKAMIKAIARAGRAISYWYLVNLYAPAYQAQSADTDFGVPIVTTASSLDASTLPGRSSVAETYRFIITELTESIIELPEIKTSIYTLNRPAAYAFLARAYLSVADYPNAITAVDRVMETDNGLLNYNQAVTNQGAGNYSLNVTAFAFLEDNPENIYVILYTYSLGMAYSQVSDSYYQIFAENENDLRRAFFSNTIYPQEYWDDYTNGTYTDIRAFNATIGPTVPEMLLIRAESNARIGNLSPSLVDLNRLRQNRFLASSYADFTSNNALEILGWVLDERKRELIGKGLRWFDMRRLNNDPDFGFTAQRQLLDGTTFDLVPNSPRYVLQIPDVALTENIVQNPL